MRRRLSLLPLLLLLALLHGRPLHAQDAAPGLCPDGLGPRLVVGEQGRRLFDGINNIRSLPGLNGFRIGQLPPGALFDVLDGPQCADGYIWWQIAYTPPGTAAETITGWTAEGLPAEKEYWLEPRGRVEHITGEDGVERAYRILPDGTMEREGCLPPPDDYERVFVGYAQLNRRTLAMLDHATQLLRLRGINLNFRSLITQGSYTGGALAASFGTHDDGGAVDISVRSPLDFSVMEEEIPLMIDALRVAGFAAWLRDTDQLYPGSIIHIHAIAIGDEDLSAAAREQIDGRYGYLRGYNALPEDWGGPALDGHGGPILCQWMIEAGYSDLRAGQS